MRANLLLLFCSILSKKKIKEKKKESNNKEYKYQADNVYLTPFRIWKSVQAQGSNTIQQY